jgi:hypothetical protein
MTIKNKAVVVAYHSNGSSARVLYYSHSYDEIVEKLGVPLKEIDFNTIPKRLRFFQEKFPDIAKSSPQEGSEEDEGKDS